MQQIQQIRLPFGVAGCDPDLLAELGNGFASEVNRWDLIARGS